VFHAVCRRIILVHQFSFLYIRSDGRDERLTVQSFYENQLFLYDLVKALSPSTK
jgi:hypothetical protein